MKYILSNVLKAFESTAVGSRVEPEHHVAVHAALQHELDGLIGEPTHGKHFLSLPAATYSLILSGDTPKTGHKAADFVVRELRGVVDKYVNRASVANRLPNFVLAIFYCKDTYMADPDVQLDPHEKLRVFQSDATHVLVALIASQGPKPALTPFRLGANLAGGNSDYVAPLDQFPGLPVEERLELMLKFAHFVQAEAAKTVQYAVEWSVVAD